MRTRLRENEAVRETSCMDKTRTLPSQLAAYAAALNFADVPKEVVTHARLMLSDTIAVAIAAEDEDVVAKLRRYASQNSGQAIVWNTDLRTRAETAALVNGATAHAMDYDDNNMAMIGHSSAPVVPAILALADEAPYSLAELLTAYIVGVQIESVLGRIAGLEHNARGWHTTATLGTFGATAACTSLFRLDRTATQHALGIAASLACGIRQNFPSMTKAVHAGSAAKNGVTAAKLAAAGVTAADDALYGAEGFLPLFSGVRAPESTSYQLQQFYVCESFPKLYPTCSMVHQALDVLLDGIASGKVNPEVVERIDYQASYHALNIMRYPDPQSVPQARFSIEYCLAVALVEGKVINEWFTADRLHDNRIRQAMSRIHVSVAPGQADKESFERLYVAGKGVHQGQSSTQEWPNLRR